MEPADDERRHRDLVDDLDRRRGLPARPVVGAFARHRVELEVRIEAGEVERMRGQRLEPAGQVVRVAAERIRGRDERAARDEHEPERDEADVVLAAGEHHVAVRVTHRQDREDRLQVRRALRGGEDLGDREVGDAVHADLAVAPRLERRPLDELVAVALLSRAEVVPRAAGAAGATDVDDHMHVAALHEVVVRTSDDAAAAVVRGDRDDDREASGRVGTMNERVQDDAVRHRDRNVRLLDDAVLRGPVVGGPARGSGGRSRDSRKHCEQEQR